MARTSPLLTWTDGRHGERPLLLLHDRYEDAATLPFASPPANWRTVRVRSPREQMAGISTLGYFWFLGSYQRPETTTFDDGLYHLETLLLTLSDSSDKSGVFMIGSGEGGVMALALAALWPERIQGVVSIDGPLPENLSTIPLKAHMLLRQAVLLLETKPGLDATAAPMSQLGANVEQRRVVPDAAMSAALAWVDQAVGNDAKSAGNLIAPQPQPSPMRSTHLSFGDADA